MKSNTLKFNISEIFYSIQGEGTRAGLPCVFIRLQGCNLRCSWCDTSYALELNQKEMEMTSDEIINLVQSYNCNFIEFTGGEPLAQFNSVELINTFAQNNYTVAVETNGHFPLNHLDNKVIKIMDIKCPASKMDKFNNYNNINFLNKSDEIKFVVLDKSDFDWALAIIRKYELVHKVSSILISPVYGKLEYKQLAEWILETRLPLKMQLQIHKFIWEPNTRGV